MKTLNIAKALNSDDIIRKGDVFSTRWRHVFQKSAAAKASDIHVEPFAGHLLIRIRVNGELSILEDFVEAELIDQLIVRLKEIAGLDISTRDEIQDGSFELSDTSSRYRVALTPTEFGESSVFRIIRDGELPKLADCKLTEAADRDLRWAIDQEKGFICVTGPTGSGKSTTLQACLMEFDRQRFKVISLEDPIERKLPGVIQQKITSKLTWAKGIKAAMRQDPDVILIGEIRDPESAALALQAAQTGHLVLSTLHTNDAPGVVDRLIGLGVERHIIADNLLFVSAQRLLPLICTACRKAQADLWVRGDGCPTCNGTGIAGRAPILEYSVRPDPNSVLNFNKETFSRDQLKQTLRLETQRLVNLGLVDARILAST